MTTTARSPLPQHHITTTEGIGGRLKERPEDFVVEEIPSYEPCGEGEHLYLGVQKVGVSHGELLRVLQRHFGVDQRAIGYAGMKDKQAVTRQVISVQLFDEPRELQPDHDRIQVLWASRHRNKLRRGHLVGNRFVIRVRGVDPIAAPRAQRTMRELEARGMPGYYGEQRFGYRLNNQRLGALLLRREHEAVCRELCGSTGSAFPEYQRERRELFDAGQYADAADRWTRADRAELIVSRALARGERWESAVRSIGRVTLNFWTSALGSAAFNACLDHRMANGTADQMLEGDLAWKHDSRAVFAVTGGDLEGPELTNRYDAFEVSPSGPLWGEGMTEPGADILRYEREALLALDTDEQLITTGPWKPEGRRRPFRDTIENVDVEGDYDDHGTFVKCVFDLRRGMYATMAMREVMKTDAVDASGASPADPATSVDVDPAGQED
ncbi:MAG: tRNA pseudouridine(13) synthase TruD [Phycisphaerales bacterium]